MISFGKRSLFCKLYKCVGAHIHKYKQNIKKKIYTYKLQEPLMKMCNTTRKRHRVQKVLNLYILYISNDLDCNYWNGQYYFIALKLTQLCNSTKTVPPTFAKNVYLAFPHY